MNELSMIFDRIALDTEEVLKAAGTKCNFHHYRPGLVRGAFPLTRITVSRRQKEVGYHAHQLLTGRTERTSFFCFCEREKTR